MKLLPVPEHTMLVFWVQLVVLATMARLFGAGMRRLGQPAVVGELAAGVVLGPSVFARLWPEGARWLFPPDTVQSGLLVAVGWLGIVMLLVGTGFETDLALIRQLGRAVIVVALCSVAVPFALGLGLGSVLPASFAGGKGRLVFALFLAAALSISSLPVIAKILGEMGLTRRNFGQLTLAAGMANDVIGWLLLGAIAGIARSGSIELRPLVVTIVGMAAFLGFSFTVGQLAVDRMLRRVRERRAGVSGAMTVTLLVAFGAGALTQGLGVEAVLGAFIAGIVLGRSRFQDARVGPHLETATLTVFAPVFFATAGLRIDLGLLGRGDVLVVAVVVLAVASIGKFAGALIGGRLAGLAAPEGLALGVGLNARGALEIVIATVGLSLGVLNGRVYTIIVLMAIATSVAAPPMLRRLAQGWAGSPEERRRLEREEAMRHNVLVRPEPLLVAVQRGDGSTIAAKILDLGWPSEAPATLLAAESDGDADAGASLARVAGVMERRPVQFETVRSDDPVAAISDHMALGFGIVGMGAWEGRPDGGLMSPLTEGLLAQSELPVLVAWDGDRVKVELVAGFGRVVVPVVSTVVNRAAQELAFSVAAACNAEVTVAHVTEQDAATASGGRVATGRRDRGELAEGMIAEAVDLARRLGVRPRTVVRHGASRVTELLHIVEESRADLLVLSAELQPVAGQPFLGNLVETLVTSTGTNVVVVAAPRTWLGAPPGP